MIVNYLAFQIFFNAQGRVAHIPQMVYNTFWSWNQVDIQQT